MRALRISAAALATLLIACSGTSGNRPPDIRRDILRDMTDIVYLPTYRQFAADARALATAVEGLCDDPSEATQQAAQAAWRAAHTPWKRAEAFQFGPVVDLRLDGAIDFWPARVADIEAELASAAPVTDAYIDGLGVSRKGLPVIEYLVFGALDRLHAGGEATRACDYAAATARAVVRSADAVVAAWEPDGDDFRGELIDAGIGSTTYSQLSEPLNDAANAIFIAIERVEGVKLAKPLGKRDGGIAQPDAVESRFSDNSIADLLDSLDGAQAAYESTRDGVTGASFRTLIAGIDATLDADVRARFDQCRADVSAIAPPLRTAVETSPGEVEVAFSCTKELLRLFKVDIAGALGVTPTFGDVDGD